MATVPISRLSVRKRSLLFKTLRKASNRQIYTDIAIPNEYYLLRWALEDKSVAPNLLACVLGHPTFTK